MFKNCLLILTLCLITHSAKVQGQTPATHSGKTSIYATQISNKIKSFLVFDSSPYDNSQDNPSAIAEIRLLSTGKIAMAEIKKSSGIMAWDKAILNAINKADTLPLDQDGGGPSLIKIVFYMKATQ